MALTKGEKITWNDIEIIYSNLNKATVGDDQVGKYGGRELFGFNNVLPIQTKLAKLENLSLLNSFISEMKSNSFLTQVIEDVNLPHQGDKLLPLFLSDLDLNVERINKTCVFNGSFNTFFCFSDCFSDCFSTNNSSFGSDGSCFGACWGSCFIFGPEGFMSCFEHEGGSGCTTFGCDEQGCTVSSFRPNDVFFSSGFEIGCNGFEGEQ